MSENYKNSSFKKLLEKLQEDSWQLELLISGFAIFGLFYAITPINNAFLEAVRGGETVFYSVLSVLRVFLYIMIFNLMLHIVLRGLWIGALGLRYISGDIDYSSLNYSHKFTNYLKRKVGSFDDYIGKLENYCSIIFAITFLLIFYVLAVFVVAILYRLIVVYIFNNDVFPEWLANGLGWFILSIFTLGSLLTFIDLVSGGLLKKNNKIAKLYFPFYLFFSLITFSFLYRPLIYNFLDDKFGKRVFLLLIPFYSIILIASSFYYQKSDILSGAFDTNEFIISHFHYEDSKNDNLQEIYINFTIQSKVIKDAYLDINLPYYKSYENFIYEFNPKLKPKKDKRGLHSSFYTPTISKKEETKKDSLRNEYLKTFNSIYRIKIDSIKYISDFNINKKGREKFGFEMFLGIDSLSQGKHILEIKRQIKKDSVGDELVAIIPFWYYGKD